MKFNIKHFFVHSHFSCVLHYNKKVVEGTLNIVVYMDIVMYFRNVLYSYCVFISYNECTFLHFKRDQKS